MNPAALKVNIDDLIPKGILVVNTGAFTPANLKKAGYDKNPLEDPGLEELYRVIRIAISAISIEALKDSMLPL